MNAQEFIEKHLDDEWLGRKFARWYFDVYLIQFDNLPFKMQPVHTKEQALQIWLDAGHPGFIELPATVPPYEPSSSETTAETGTI